MSDISYALAVLTRLRDRLETVRAHGDLRHAANLEAVLQEITAALFRDDPASREELQRLSSGRGGSSV